MAGKNRVVLAGIACMAVAVALFAWLIPWDGVLDRVGRSSAGGAGSGASAESVQPGEEGGVDSSSAGEVPGEGAEADGLAGGGSGGMEAAASGEDFSEVSPTRRYVTETQRHQNFLAAVAAGQVRRMDFVSTDYQPASDPDSSYISFSLLTSDGKRSTGVMVMKQESGMWRISSVRQLSGSLGGGTNYLVPAGFEDVLAEELQHHQPFFSKLAQGRVKALIVDEDQHPSDTETVLIGRVEGVSGRIEETIMFLRKDYNLWHLTGFDYR